MDQSKAAGAHHLHVKRTYEDFEPFCKWHHRDNAVELHLQGFRKEHLSVRTTQMGMLTIHGERPLDEAKSTWSRFHKEMKLPNNCDTNRVAAKFAAGVLTITMPPKTDDQKQPLASSDDKSSHVDDNQENNEEAAVAKIDKQNQDGNASNNGEDAALLEEVKHGSKRRFGERSYLLSKKLIAVKIVMVVAALVTFGVKTYLRYKHDHNSYALAKIN